MEIIRTIAWMKEHTRQARTEGRIVGLVPTMGALHEGHLALVRRAKQECAPVIASIFLNPKQFGPKEDLAKYPRSFEGDVEKLNSVSADALFAPEPAEVYPPGFSTSVYVEGLSERLEGRTRPGHFRGVTTVVLKLLEIVQPHFAYFGRKDAQQVHLIQQMVRDLNLDTEIVTCPIVREKDGLALSSRNAYLSEQERRAATVLYRALDAARREMNSGARDPLRLQHLICKVLESEPLAHVDYAEVVDSHTFEPLASIRGNCYVLLAVRIGKTRLIDNLFVEAAGSDSQKLLFHL